MRHCGSRCETSHLKREIRHSKHQTISTQQMPMECKRCGIYLADFNPSKGTGPGKIRPCLVMQSNLLNEAGHPNTTLLPLTTKLIDEAAPLRYRLMARDGLESHSDIMLDQIRTIDNRRMTSDLLIILTEKEINMLANCIGIRLIEEVPR